MNQYIPKSTFLSFVVDTHDVCVADVNELCTIQLIGESAKRGSDVCLKNWLAKGQMADRVVDKASFQPAYSSYYGSLPSEAKERYQKKLQYASNAKSLPDPYSLTEKWSTDPSTWPDLTFGDIYMYLIDTPSIFTKDSMKAYKSLDAYNYVVSRHVQVVLSHLISDDCPFIALKTKVTPSQRNRDKPHQPWVYLDKTSGSVYCAHCTCMAGLGEVCSHVAALLFKVEMGVKIGMNNTSSTSKACQWNSTFRKEVIPTTVTDIFDHIKGRRIKEVSSVQATGSAPLPSPEVLDSLYSLIPNAAFFTSVTAPSQIEKPEPVNKPDKFPKLLTTFQDINIDRSTLDTTCHSLFEDYTCSEYQASNLEEATRNQSVSSLWYQHRMDRVTASKAHDVLTRRSATPPENLVNRIMGYNTYNLSKKEAVKWGIDNEDECRQAYTVHQTQQHVGFNCRASGFHVSTDHPFLGASPDGIINCQCCGKGILEIKCPYKHKNTTVQQAAATDPSFYLDKNLHLKRTHKYFTQVQFQMFILKVQFCDFVVYTKCEPAPSMVIVRIPIDSDFCQSIITLCNQFVKNYVIKELITRDQENQPVTSSALDGNNNSNSKTWCLCAEPEYGRMIKCNNNECPYQWFHYKCVNIRRLT